MATVELAVEYHEAQERMFHGPNVARFNVYPKGRRFGATTGAGFAVVEWLLEGHRVLWGDTVYSNINRYFTRIIRPVLERNRIPHDWKQQGNELRIGRGVCDFRSADNPETWEGFGYSRIVLNEAGIILRDPYLFTNAVLPMTADYPDARLFAIGTPKGAMGSFYELWRSVAMGEEGHQGERFSSYDNPFLDVETMRTVEAKLGPVQARQEVYGHFLGSTSSTAIFSADEVMAAVGRAVEVRPDDELQVGVDVAWTGDDESVVAVRRGRRVSPLVKFSNVGPVELAQRVLAIVRSEAKAGEVPIVGVDVVGIGAGVYDLLRRDPSVRAVGVGAGERALSEEVYANVRAEMWFALQQFVREDGGALPNDPDLRADLLAQEYEFDARGRYKLPLKDRVKRKLGRSPDCGDAVCLSVYRPPVLTVTVI